MVLVLVVAAAVVLTVVLTNKKDCKGLERKE